MNRMDVHAVIARAKEALELKTDVALAEALDIPRETIASWKRRGSIPAKYMSYMTSHGLSIDWLLTGIGEVFTSNEYGMANDRKDDLDDEALWIAMILMVRELRSSSDNLDKSLGEKINRRGCREMHVLLSKLYPRIIKSKKKWEGSGILKKGETYKALAVEYDLGDFDFHMPPWWEDEELI